MKLRIAIIAALMALIALMLAAPAYAADKTYYTEPQILTDDTGVVITIDHVKVSDLPEGYSIFNYPPTQYQFYTLYYTLSNPTDQRIRFQFNINFVDDKGRSFTSEEYNLAEWLNPNDRSTLQPKEFAVYRNASDVHLKWRHIDRYWNNETATTITLVEEIKSSPTITPTPEVTPTRMATPTATQSPTPAPAPGFEMVFALVSLGSVYVFINRLNSRR